MPKESIEVAAQSIGINNLSPDVAAALAPDVEYRIREIMQEAIKCMRHSKRTVLTAEDVESALSLRNVEPIYGFASGDPLRFKRATGHKDLYYIDDKDIDLKDVIEAPLPRAPLDAAVVAHWLAIEGVQPVIPENAPLEALGPPPETKKAEHVKDENVPIDIKLPVKHVLSRELQMYFDKITELAISRPKPDPDLFDKALVSLATDSGLHPLVPYFSYFVADEVAKNLSDVSLLFSLMRVVRSLLQNPNLHIEPYLHQLMPSIITCLVAKRLGQRLADDHWELRDFCARLVASVCRRFGHVYHNLQSRVTRTLLHAFLDPTKALTQHYGAIQGLAALGPNVVRLLVLPNLETYIQLLETEMLLEKQKNETKRNEAWRVYGALLCAAGHCLYDRLKMFPGILTPSARSILRNDRRVATTLPSKRKSTSDISAQQPPLKKLAADGPVQGAPEGISGTADVGTSGTGQISKQSTTSEGRKQDVGRTSKASLILAQAWREDVEAGRLLASLHELFGEAVFPFTQPVEMSFFL